MTQSYCLLWVSLMYIIISSLPVSSEQMAEIYDQWSEELGMGVKNHDGKDVFVLRNLEIQDDLPDTAPVVLAGLAVASMFAESPIGIKNFNYLILRLGADAVDTISCPELTVDIFVEKADEIICTAIAQAEEKTGRECD